MVSIFALWLPILLSAVIVFIASSIMHMLLPYHRGDYKQLPDEDRLLGVLRSVDLKRGLYMFPYCTHKDMKSPAIAEKQKLGPVGTMTVFPKGPVNMPKYLAMWFAYCLMVSAVVAYLAGRSIPFGEEYLRVFRTAGIAAFLAFGVGQLVNSVWAGQPWSVTLKHVFDGLIYSLLTAGILGWLWPR